MELVTLKKLRKKQFIALNCGSIIGLVFFFLLLYVGIPLNKMLLFLGIIILIIAIFKNKYISYIFKIFPYKEKLFLYEKNKLGREWYRLNKMNNIATVVLGIVSLLQGIISDDAVISFDVLIISIIISPLFLILINCSLYFHIKKIDNAGSSSFNGYTKKRLVLSILAAIVYVVIINIVVILLIEKIII